MTGYLAILIGKPLDSLVVLSVVVLNTLIGFVQEYRAHKTIQALTTLVPDHTSVIRGGTLRQIPSTHLVPGDLVVLQEGDRIGADIRLIEVAHLRCDESTLTGESMPVDKEMSNMAFKGTYVTKGSGKGIVIATGMDTELGRISTLVEQVHDVDTPIVRGIKSMAHLMSWVVLGISAFLWCVGYLRGAGVAEAAFAAVALAVAAIPEGLPAMITIASAIGVKRMARHHAIIRHLPAVEALGSTSIICTDKTGTLTYNEMRVHQMWTPFDVKILLQAAMLCNDAVLEVGDPTERALLIEGRKLGLEEEALRKAFPCYERIPFDSAHRRMVTSHQDAMGKRFSIVKGAPEEAVALCNSQELHRAEEMARQGMRVLAVAQKEENSQFILLGFIGMIDPPRKEVYQALKSCRQAGVHVKMITGDHPLTARAIGEDLGFSTERIWTGAELDQLDAEEWKRVAAQGEVFARVSPQNKLLLVQTLQNQGHVVAMTGDGVNDAPALKQADIGVAMGLRGTAVARTASDMILADDDFASIESAVEEGRRVYDNLIKSLAFILPTSFGQALVIIGAILFFPVQATGLLYPMSPVQILWVNLIVAVGLSLSLSLEPAEENIMQRPPREKRARMLDRASLFQVTVVASVMAGSTIGLFLWEYYRELNRGAVVQVAIAEAQTLAVTAMMIFQVFYLFQCRKGVRGLRSNPSLFLGVIAVLVAQVAFIYLPWMNRFFGSLALDGEAWLTAGVVMGLTTRILPRK